MDIETILYLQLACIIMIPVSILLFNSALGILLSTSFSYVYGYTEIKITHNPKVQLFLSQCQ